jgi:CHAP domain-containing protein
MTLDAVLLRIAQLQGTMAPATATGGAAAPAGAGASPVAFASALQGATGAPASTALPAAGGTNAGRAALAAAEQEVGVAEQPPGSNDGPRIAQFRQATAGAGVGPWCSYFVSWAARQAGAPLGDHGQGFGRVDDVWAWAQQSGRSVPAGSRPEPGDLIVWDEHIGIVSKVDAGGSIHTVEGNSSDRVSERTYGADGGGAVGYVRLG